MNDDSCGCHPATHIPLTATSGGGHVTWSVWGHVGAGIGAFNVPPWSPRGTFGPWISQVLKKFMTDI